MIDILISTVLNAGFFTAGYSVSTAANYAAELIAHPAIRSQAQPNPKETLGKFYKSLALKWTVFTILTFVLITAAPDQAHWALLGIMANVLVNKRLSKQIEKYEPHHAYSN